MCCRRGESLDTPGRRKPGSSAVFLSWPGFRLAAPSAAMAQAGGNNDRNQDATVYVGDLEPQVTEPILWELMTQAGPVGE